MISADQTIVQVTDTDTVDMTISGNGSAGSPYVISSAVKLDSTPPGGGTNLIKSNAEGLYLECAQVRTCISEGPGIDYNPATGVISAQISGLPGNVTTIGGDGGIYTASSGQLSVVDTSTVDHTLTGTGTAANPYVLSSTVKLNPTPPGGGTNLIQTSATGLYLECAQVRTCLSEGPGIDYDPVTGVIKAQISTQPGNTTSIGPDGGILTPVSGQVTVQDTSTVDMTLTGTGTAASPYVVSSVVKLEPAPPGGGTNLIKTGANGLYLECAQVRTCISEGPGIDYDPATGVIKAQISTQAGNVTSIGPDGGIYTSSSGQLTVQDTSTVDHTLTGTGTAASPYVLSSVVKLDPTPPGGGTNLIKAGANGLYLECAQVRTCISEGPGIDYDPATGVIKAQLSADGGNSLTFGTDGGLWAPVGGGGGGTIVQILDTSSVDMAITGTGAAGDPYVIKSDVRLDPTPPGGGTNLIKLNSDGLYLECAQVRTCISEGPGIDYDPATGVIKAQISTDAGNTTVIGTDGGLYTPASGGGGSTVVTAGDTPTVDNTVTGAGTAASPYVVSSVVKLDPAPPGGGTNLIKAGANGLYLECAQVRTCISEGPGIDYDPATGVIKAQISTDAGNQTKIGTDGGLFSPAAAALVTGCGLDGVGTAADPLVVVPEAGQEAWSATWTCDAPTHSTLKCDPTTGKLWTPPEHYSAEDHIYVDHFTGGFLTPIGPSGGWRLVDAGANQQFNLPANFVGNDCRTYGYVVGNTGNFDIEYTTGSVFDVGLVVVQDGNVSVRPLWGELSSAPNGRRIRRNGNVYVTNWNIPAGTPSSIAIYPAVNVTSGQITRINQWTSDAFIIYTTNTP
ncbi:hypothetical protein [Streptomyces sp. NRRL S-350]|uniref:hypothetical protein n=1 Tax=Streptomyces sp. NRRL S-350 TaxID=1463902 RepID=UPI0004C28D4B|nr:hypothetical protein [Streptomyces sp. NRRL S-350]